MVQGQNGWGVTYTSTEICALEGSTVAIRCTYTYPSRINDRVTAVEETFWFTRDNDYQYVNLRKASVFAGRLQFYCNENSCTLRITDLRQSDSGVYYLSFITNQPGGRYTGELGVTLSVKVLQVNKDPSRSQLQCYSSCRLPVRPSYIWYKNGEKISENQKEMLYYSNNNRDSYSCAVRGHEDFPSPSVCINDQSCNRVTYTDRSICVFRGSSVNISCKYNSYGRITSKFWFSPERSRQWQNPSQPEDLRTDSQYTGRVQVINTERGGSTLRITDLRESDSGQYRFKFKTANFEWGSSLPGTTLTVTALQVQVITLTVQESYTEAELKCHSSCSSAARLSYVWFKNGQKVIKEDNSYIDRFYPGDIISCALKGHENYRSPSVYALKVPSVSVNPQSEIMEGSSVTLTCSSDANPAAKYTWYKKNQTLLNREPQLVFSSIQSSDSGEYYCTAENELGRRTSQYIFINVKYAPKLPSVSVSPSGEIVEGSSVNLTCSSDANPAANYTWYREDQTLFRGPEGIYHFFSISSEDRGTYYCKSDNQYGNKSSSILIDVQYAPKLPSVSVSPSGEIVEGSSVTLTCSSDANPAANYTWYKENEESPKASGQIFTITDIRPEHSGNYYCEAQNRRGRHNNTLYLIVLTDELCTLLFSCTPGKSVNIMNIIRLTLVVLMLIPVFVLSLWTRKKKTLSLKTEINKPVEIMESECFVDYENISVLRTMTAAQTDDSEEQEDLV